MAETVVSPWQLRPHAGPGRLREESNVRGKWIQAQFNKIKNYYSIPIVHKGKLRPGGVK